CIVKAFRDFCNDSPIQHLRIQKGKSLQTAYIERIYRSCRVYMLDAFIFGNENTQEIFDRKKLMKNSIPAF
ncbi:MAG: hypothetical protein ACK4IY_01060, partial [Chitinophagales bacterium]